MSLRINFLEKRVHGHPSRSADAAPGSCRFAWSSSYHTPDRHIPTRPPCQGSHYASSSQQQAALAPTRPGSRQYTVMELGPTPLFFWRRRRWPFKLTVSDWVAQALYRHVARRLGATSQCASCLARLPTRGRGCGTLTKWQQDPQGGHATNAARALPANEN